MSTINIHAVETPQQEILRQSITAVVRVGDGRGFVVQAPKSQRVVLTAAHCLPEMPTPHAANSSADRTFYDLIGPLGNEPSIAVECLFACPVADVAVLGCPDQQQLWDQAEAFEQRPKE